MRIITFLAGCFLTASLTCAHAATNPATGTTASYSSQSEDGRIREITVYKLTPIGQSGNAASSQAFTGYYDAANNKIKVGRFTYTVSENRAYGQANDYRSEYRYVAGPGDYYFNL